MVLVDTTVWISLYRNESATLGRRLWQLAARNEAAICGQVWVEFLGGFRNRRKRDRYTEQLAAYRWLDTPRGAFERAAEWLARYPALGAGDTIIAATAAVNAASLLTLDRDFAMLAAEGLKVETIN